MVGAKAVVFSGSVIGEGSIIGMGAVVLENTRIPKKSIAVGIPAKVIKPVDDTTYSKLKRHAIWYNKLAKSHKGTVLTGLIAVLL
jgi:carbonic anhydrase/acetyltransferase-like protein (isoleucine patch superfamily)